MAVISLSTCLIHTCLKHVPSLFVEQTVRSCSCNISMAVAAKEGPPDRNYGFSERNAALANSQAVWDSWNNMYLISLSSHSLISCTGLFNWSQMIARVQWIHVTQAVEVCSPQWRTGQRRVKNKSRGSTWPKNLLSSHLTHFSHEGCSCCNNTKGILAIT